MEQSKRLSMGMLLAVLLLLALTLTAPVLAQTDDLTELNCALTPDQILGQVFGGTAGAAGETGEGQLTPEGDNILENELDADIEWLLENLQYSDTGSQNVALLVVDDFSSEPYDPDEENVVSHGWLVLDVLQQIHDALPDGVASRIRIEEVNIADENGYRSDLIQSAIADTIESLQAEGYERFVINMSFVFIPCVDTSRNFNFARFQEAREGNPQLSVIEALGGDVDYVQQLLTDPRVTAIDENGLEIDADADPGRRIGGPPDFVQEQVNILRFFEDNRLQGDPMRRFFADLDVLAVPVASAGNFKWRRPFYPARWREVLSVSASEGDDLEQWGHSNSGEVMVPGAWFLFEDEVFRAGTSFAAPVASMMIALDFTQDRPMCGVRGGAPLLASANFGNRPLVEAAEDC
jgi:hypothetical protein